jgi:hypothetical protein
VDQTSTQASDKTLEETIMTQSADSEAEQLDVFNVIAEQLELIERKYLRNIPFEELYQILIEEKQHGKEEAIEIKAEDNPFKVSAIQIQDDIFDEELDVLPEKISTTFAQANLIQKKLYDKYIDRMLSAKIGADTRSNSIKLQSSGKSATIVQVDIKKDKASSKQESESDFLRRQLQYNTSMKKTKIFKLQDMTLD